MAKEFLGEKKVCRSAYAVDMAERIHIYLGTCTAHNRPVRVDMDKDMGQFTAIPCPEGDLVNGERLNAVTTTLECDGSCRSAFHSECVCGCGGMNHGISWMNRMIAMAGGTHFVTGAVLDQAEVTDSALATWRDRRRQVEIKREQRQATKEARERASFDQWAEDHSDVVRALDGWHEHRTDTEWQEATGVRWGQHILVDFAIQTHGGWNGKPKPLSEKQIALAFKLLREGAEFLAKKAEQKKDAKPVPEGRIQIKGTIVKIKASEGFSYDDVRIQMTVASAEGYAVMVTLPAEIRRDAMRTHKLDFSRAHDQRGPDYYYIQNELMRVLKGTHVTFNATVKRSSKDDSFGFGSRPSLLSWTPAAE
jgi:hypothetical protein